MTKNLKTFQLSLAVLLGLSTVSCSKETELIDTIPANVGYVARVDLVNLAEAGGFKITADNIEFPDYLAEATKVADSETLKFVANSFNSVDMKNLYFLSYENIQLLTFKIVDQDAFYRFNDSVGNEFTTQDGFKITGKGAVAIKDNQGWVVADRDFNKKSSPSRITENINNMLKAAKENPITSYKAVTESLAKPGFMSVAANPFTTAAKIFKAEDLEKIESLNKDNWNTGVVTISDYKILCKAVSINGHTGDVVKAKGTKPIDTKVFAHTPANSLITFAMGIDKGFDWKTIIDTYSNALGYQVAGPLGVIRPYLESIDGTLMVSAKPRSPQLLLKPGLDTWDFIGMIKLSPEKAEEAINSINNAILGYNLPTKRFDDGSYELDIATAKIYYGVTDGYFAVANYPINNTSTNSLAKYFDNYVNGAVVEIDHFNSILPILPEWGFSMVSQSTETENNTEITLPGSEDPIIESLVKFCVNLAVSL